MKELEVVVDVVCSGWDGMGSTAGVAAGADVEAGTRAEEGGGATDGAAMGAATGTTGAVVATDADEATSLVDGRAKKAKPVVEAICGGAGAGRTVSSSSSWSASISSSSTPNLANFLSFFSSSPSLVKKCNSRKAG